MTRVSALLALSCGLVCAWSMVAFAVVIWKVPGGSTLLVGVPFLVALIASQLAQPFVSKFGNEYGCETKIRALAPISPRFVSFSAASARVPEKIAQALIVLPALAVGLAWFGFVGLALSDILKH